MTYSNLALLNNRDFPNILKTLKHNWEYFLAGEKVPNKIRTLIYESWKRCQSHNVNPLQQESPIIMSDEQLQNIINESEFYWSSLPVIEEIYTKIKGTEHLITLSDDKGRIIHLEGDKKTLEKGAEMNFIIGADWSEQVAGSNAIGTSLETGEPVQIFSYEHFCEGVHPWVCSAAPIRDPFNQEILGIIDLTGPSELAQPHSLSVVQTMSQLIEKQISKKSQQKFEFLSMQYNNLKNKMTRSSIAVLNDKFHILKADQSCLTLLKINEWDDFWAHPKLSQIKEEIENNDINIIEQDIPSLNLKIIIEKIFLQDEHIGYSCILEKQIVQSKEVQTSKANQKYGIVSISPKINEIMKKVDIIANTNVPVLITGESGTGKEVLSSTIHKKSARNNEPYITVNCGAIPESLIASELFGYEPGAFTGGDPNGKKGKFEEANGGTILLDEIGEMPTDLQVHLLRVLQEKEVTRLGSAKPIPIDVRIIAATNQDIKQLINEKKFRSDLYYRLNVVQFHLPPLRERKEDIPVLSQYFVKQLAEKHDRNVPTIDNEVLTLFDQLKWRGNIRELQNILEFAVLFNHNDHITINSLPEQLITNAKQNKKENEVDDQFTPLEREEKRKIEQLLRETNGNISEVARRCNIARTTLYRKMERYDIKN